MMVRSLLLSCLCLIVVAGTPTWAGTSGDAVDPARNVDPTLKLAEFAFDPAKGEPALPEGWARSRADVSDLHLVQFDGPVDDVALEELRKDGLEPIRYVHPNSYVVWGRTEQRSAFSRRPSVRWAGDFAPAYRVLRQWRDLEGMQEVRVLIYRGADADGVVDRLTAIGGELVSRRVLDARLELAGFSLPGDRMQTAASIPGVYSIQLQPTDGGSRGEVSSQISVGNVDASNLALPGYLTWLATVGLDGSGVVIASVDEGIDETHPDLAARMLPCTGTSCSTQGSLHGTHTAGIIAADNSSGVVADNGFLRGLGVAPGANLIEQRYYPTMLQPDGMLTLMAESFRNGAIVSSNSWGPSASAVGYDINTMMVDIGVRDADPFLPGNQQLIFVQAIDNGQGGVSTQGAPDDAKNILSVGATRSMLTDGTPDPAIDSLASVSAHGPALDGRILPDLVAPGCLVDSTYPDDGQGNLHYARCGTSMAAPQVTGAVGLFLEYYRGLPGYTRDASPALVKAAFTAVAHDLEGNEDADLGVMGHRPDSKQGWGRLNTDAVVNPPAGSVIYVDQTTTFDFSGQEWMRAVVPVDPARPMRIMLAWTDAPGHGLGGTTPAWNNDLDLVVDAGGLSYLGNNFGLDGYSIDGGAADFMNNTEGVFFQVPPSGEINIRVLATNINSDGVPGEGEETDQDFALVCYNCAFAPAFALTPDPTTVEVCAPVDREVTIDVESLGGFTDPVTLSTTGTPTGATSSFSVNPADPGTTTTLILDPGSAVDGDYALQIQGDAALVGRSASVMWRLRTGMPVPAPLTSPPNASVGVPTRPLLQWDASPWTSRYLVEIASDPGFSNLVYHAVADGTSHEVRHPLWRETTYYWRVRGTNACGYGDYSPGSSFTTGTPTTVLLVDDDWDLPDEQARWTGALDALGIVYDLWDVYAVHNGDQPDAYTLATYDTVIWFTGKEEVYPGPTLHTQLALEDWLDRSACFLISSQDFVFARGFNPFIQDRLGVASVVEDTGQTEVEGRGSVFGTVPPPDPPIVWSLKNLAANDFRDSLTPDATAELAFQGDLGPAAVNKDGGFYRTAFFGYGLEDMSAPGQEDTLSRFLTWCDGLPDVDGDLDGVVNASDCAPGDPSTWTAPSPIDDLRMSKDLAAGFVWTEPLQGGRSVYDVIRSQDYTDFYNATCVASGLAGTIGPADRDDPAPGELYFYLVGARNGCGLSTLGNNLDGSPRYGTACE